MDYGEFSLGYFGSINGTDQAGLSPEVKTFYDRALITLAQPELVHDQFGQRRPLPQGSGRTVEFRRFSGLPEALSPITEGVSPSGGSLEVSTVSVRPEQYGGFIEQTDLLEMTAVDNTVLEATRLLASQAGRTLDAVVRNELCGGTNVMYSPHTDGRAVTSRADVTSDCHLTVRDVFKAAAALKAVNAPKFDGYYAAIIHPYAAYDLMQEAGSEWTDISKYASPDSVLLGEIGRLGGVRFTESTEAKIFAPAEIINGISRFHVSTAAAAGATEVQVDEQPGDVDLPDSIEVWAGGARCSLTGITVSGSGSKLTFASALPAISAGSVICGTGAARDGGAVFTTLFIGDGAYGVTDLAGGGLEHIVKQRGYGDDPLDQRSAVGWKAVKAAKRLVEEYMVRVESGSSWSAGATAN